MIRRAVNWGVIVLTFISFTMMFLAVMTGCNAEKIAAKKKAKEDKEKYVNCVVTAKRYKDCRIWLNCGGKNQAINDCDIIESVNKFDVIQLERKPSGGQ